MPGAHAHVPSPPERPWAVPERDALRALDVDPARGLGESEALARRRRFGPNELRRQAPRRVGAILKHQLESVVVVLLVAAAGLSLAFGDVVEGIAILAVIAINTAIGFVTEWRAARSMEALRRLARVDAVLRRDGRAIRLPAERLVPGDIVQCEGGDVVTADLRLVEASRLEADESTLTGESLPVAKCTGVLAAETPLMERSNMLYKGTVLTRGSGLAVVVGTGTDTELGRIAALVATAEPEATPLERRLNALAARLVWITLALALGVAAAGVLGGRDTVLAIQVAIALAVAAIPEGLPIVATIALARGMWRMAKRNALIAELSAVETLGTTSTILTDKTGTLTENRMAVTTVLLPGAVLEAAEGADGKRGEFRVDGHAPGAELAARLEACLALAALCNNSSLEVSGSGEIETLGDPTESALLIAAHGLGLSRSALEERLPRAREVAFEPETKAMATYHRDAGRVRIAVKGAPEMLLERCVAVCEVDGDTPLTDAARACWIANVDALGAHGLRTLAIATRFADSTDQAPYEGLTLLGVLGLEDPAREGVEAAIGRCADAGIRVVMVTGDHAATAARIALEVGIVDAHAASEQFVDARTLTASGALDDAADSRVLLQARVISRATPEQKLALIDFFQRNGRVVAMTGDGVNDAPALRKADIGIAMGRRGVPVAREAAVMILEDDEFGTIIEAVAQGRTIFANIRKFVVYLLSCNIAEILVVGLATAVGAPLPLLPLQILFLNLVTDVFPALALGVGGGTREQMTEPPRPSDEGVVTRSHWLAIFAYGLVMAAAVLGAMAFAVGPLGLDGNHAVTVSFTTLALAQLWHVFNMRSRASRALGNEITRNGWVWGALALCLALIGAALSAPGLRDVLSLEPIGFDAWLVVGAFSIVPLVAGPVLRRTLPAARGARQPSRASAA